jgi:hypothetical protein
MSLPDPVSASVVSPAATQSRVFGALKSSLTSQARPPQASIQPSVQTPVQDQVNSSVVSDTSTVAQIPVQTPAQEEVSVVSSTDPLSTDPNVASLGSLDDTQISQEVSASVAPINVSVNPPINVPISSPAVMDVVPDLSNLTPPPSELETIAAAIPAAVQAADTLNPASPSGSVAKESPNLTFSVEKPVIDQIPGMQVVENEKNHELPPEVEGFIKSVENHQDQIPQEIVIADQTTGQTTPRYLAQPVIVLPITPEVEKLGGKKSPNFSVRWLVEWSHRLMKMFSGRVIYRESKVTS